jgi:hypothetical protein
MGGGRQRRRNLLLSIYGASTIDPAGEQVNVCEFGYSMIEQLGVFQI